MAITHQAVRDTSTLVRAVVTFSTVGALLGALGGWQVETAKLSEAERFHMTHYTVGRALHWVGLERDHTKRPVRLVSEYQGIKKAHPIEASRMEAAAFAALVVPWPLLGVLMGLGGLTLLSKFNDFISSRGKK
jgi:hypothetical protein